MPNNKYDLSISKYLPRTQISFRNVCIAFHFTLNIISNRLKNSSVKEGEVKKKLEVRLTVSTIVLMIS